MNKFHFEIEPFTVNTSKNKGFANNSNLLPGNNTYFCCPASFGQTPFSCD
jgi:hypothetical protein